jgi:hypothetical protein
MTANPQHSSATQEHYTPACVVDPARRVLGAFDLDPASCPEANATIKATRIYTRADDGLTKPWANRVFLNPPGGTLSAPEDAWIREQYDTGSRQVAWWRALTLKHVEGEVRLAIFVGFSIEIMQASQHEVWPSVLDYPFCVPSKRLKFNGDQPTHANVIVFVCPKDRPLCRAGFAEHFAPLGRVVIP